MKSLWRISIRYIMTAVCIAVFIILANISIILYICYRTMEESTDYWFSTESIENIGNELVEKNGKYVMSSMGYALMEESAHCWAMYIDEKGDVAWEYQLPPEIPLHYELADIASMSRWYLKDYPVAVWKHGGGLMVYGYEKEAFVRLNMISNIELIRQFPGNAGRLLILNIIFLILLVLILAYRFYCSLRPIEGSIMELERKELLRLPERGLVKELAEKLNRVAITLREQDEQLKKRDNARTNWIAGVSHDIRTPLALITGYSDEIMHEELSREEIQKKAELIQKQSVVIKQLIENLNLTSKLEYQVHPLKKEEILPAQLMRECVAEYYNQGLDDSYELVLIVQETVEKKKVLVDKVLLLRAFRNLIGNSIRHNLGGCRLEIRLQAEEKWINVLFSDSGEGIPKKVVEVLEKEPEQVVYTGVHVMGLRVVKQIVQAHGGFVKFVKKQNGNYDISLQIPQI